MLFYLSVTFFRTNNWCFSTFFLHERRFCLQIFHTGKGQIFLKLSYKKMSAKLWEQPTVWRTIFRG